MANLGQKDGIYLIRFRYHHKEYKRSLKAQRLVELTISVLLTGFLQVRPGSIPESLTRNRVLAWLLPLKPARPTADQEGEGSITTLPPGPCQLPSRTLTGQTCEATHPPGREPHPHPIAANSAPIPERAACRAMPAGRRRGQDEGLYDQER